MTKSELERISAFIERLDLLDLESFDDLKRYPDVGDLLVEGQVMEQQGPEAPEQAELDGDGYGCMDTFMPAFMSPLMSRRSVDGTADKNLESSLQETGQLASCLPMLLPSCITACISEEDCQRHNTADKNSFAHSARSSRSSNPNRSPGRSSPKSPYRSPKGDYPPSDSWYVKSSQGRINENSMSFSFTIPNQPKYAEAWEWRDEYTGVDAKQGIRNRS
jgi:hypothetical protein